MSRNPAVDYTALVHPVTQGNNTIGWVVYKPIDNGRAIVFNSKRLTKATGRAFDEIVVSDDPSPLLRDLYQTRQDALKRARYLVLTNGYFKGE